jgi:hypothetical protein
MNLGFGVSVMTQSLIDDIGFAFPEKPSDVLLSSNYIAGVKKETAENDLVFLEATLHIVPIATRVAKQQTYEVPQNGVVFMLWNVKDIQESNQDASIRWLTSKLQELEKIETIHVVLIGMSDPFQKKLKPDSFSTYNKTKAQTMLIISKNQHPRASYGFLKNTQNLFVNATFDIPKEIISFKVRIVEFASNDRRSKNDQFETFFEKTDLHFRIWMGNLPLGERNQFFTEDPLTIDPQGNTSQINLDDTILYRKAEHTNVKTQRILSPFTKQPMVIQNWTFE